MKTNIIIVLVILVTGWMASDLLIPRKKDLRNFDPIAVGQLDADMWRSYYERKRVKLFWQLSRLMREQFNAPFWRSFPMAYQAAKAATVFQDGRNREQYRLALPFLERYFRYISALSVTPFQVEVVAEKELEWWIIRREPKHTAAEWENLLALTAAEMYRQPIEKFEDYAQLRVQAMGLRDERGNSISEKDWAIITGLLKKSWGELHRAVQ